MGKIPDCVVVGHNGAEELAFPRSDKPLTLAENHFPRFRDLRRNRIEVHQQFRTFLDAFSTLRHAGPDGEKVPTYTVEELPSLTALYLVNFLRRRGLGAFLVNSFTFEQRKLSSILASKPRLVAVTTTFYLETSPVREIVRFVREREPDIPVVIGGPLVFNICENVPPSHRWHIFDTLGADFYVWEAQGEKTLELLLRSLDTSRPGEVPNVYRRIGDEWVMTGRRIESNLLDDGAIDWKGFEKSELGTTVSTRTARSCAFACSFCDYPSRAGSLSLASLETVRDELMDLARMGVERVSFVDDTFNVPVRRFRSLCALMAELDLGIEFFCYFRCSNATTDDDYDALSEAGCRGVFLGVESGDDRLLAAMNKKATAQQHAIGIERLRERGIFVHASFLVGFPGETPGSVSRTIEFIQSARPDTFTASPWLYLHSTPVHSRASELGLQGEGRQWRHDTMSSQESLDQTDRIFLDVDESAWLPVSGLDFWGIPYLLGVGFAKEEILEMLRFGYGSTPLGVKGGGRDRLPDFADLARSLKLLPPRYFI